MSEIDALRRPLRILHVTTASDRISGAERLLVDMARIADRKHWDLTFLTLAKEDVLHSTLRQYGWTAHSAGLSGLQDLPRALARIVSVVRRTQPDIIHTHLWHPAVLGGALSTFVNARVVETRHYHDFFFARQMRVRVSLARWATRRMAGVACVSLATKTHLIENERIPEQQIVVIENGVDTDRLAACSNDEGRERLKDEGVRGRPVVVCAATLESRKGHKYLIEAFRGIVRMFPEAQLVLLGTGPLMQTIRTEARELGLEAAVHLLGHRDDVHILMAGADVYVQPSVEEGFGLAAVEAMAMGLPVVVSDVGGMQQTVQQGVTGVRVPPQDAAALTEAVASLLSNPTQAASMATAAKRAAAMRFSIRRMIDEYDAWYGRLLRLT